MFGPSCVAASLPVVLDGNSTAFAAAQLHRARALDLKRLQRRLEAKPVFSQLDTSLFVEHVAGVANAVANAGSRQHWHVLAAIAAAFGIRLKQRDLTPRALTFLQD
eukprot:2719768-Pleurochrysis_carterae.AAC.1